MNNLQHSATVKTWLAHPLPAEVKSAVDRLARTDDARHVAVMPDMHLAHEVCVGSVLATSRLIYPAAVGGDIGCGMASLAFDADADLLRDEMHAARLLAQLAIAAPAIRHVSRETSPGQSPALAALPLSHPRLESIRRRDGVVQLGTLGRGNHFLEFQADEEDRLWVMVHSGSRAMGPAIRDWHLRQADKSKTGLLYLDSQSDLGLAYLADANWARVYACENRRAMLDGVAAVLSRLFSVVPIAQSHFDCDHNHVRHERHFGDDVWVHRKGAASAGEGETGIIPGSMGTESYHVQGRGCADSLNSSSHGAGRVMSRSDALKNVTPRQLDHQMQGVWYDRRMTRTLLEEAPSAYKDIRQVMRAQRDLTRIRRRLIPLLSYKAG